MNGVKRKRERIEAASGCIVGRGGVVCMGVQCGWSRFRQIHHGKRTLHAVRTQRMGELMCPAL